MGGDSPYSVHHLVTRSDWRDGMLDNLTPWPPQQASLHPQGTLAPRKQAYADDGLLPIHGSDQVTLLFFERRSAAEGMWMFGLLPTLQLQGGKSGSATLH